MQIKTLFIELISLILIQTNALAIVADAGLAPNAIVLVSSIKIFCPDSD